MGNLLASENHFNVSNIESYFEDISGIKFYKNIWRTRFLKTVHAKLITPSVLVDTIDNTSSYDYSHLIDVVAKVFIFNMIDSNVGLPFKVKITDQRIKLTSIPSCAPYQVTLITNRAALLIRQYFYQSLYDRLNTRPFLTHSEKLWIIFQLLHCIKDVHEAQVIHGDIKLENIMITTWNWIVLTDFSCAYKPAILSLENPTPNFNYFFDTSRRRNCYLAPERFASTQINSTYNPNFVCVNKKITSNQESNGIASTGQHKRSSSSSIFYQSNSETKFSSNSLSVDFQLWTNKPTISMDLFSIGCCFYEIYTEGKVLFDFSQLLQYKSNTENYATVCSRIDNNIKDVILSNTIKNLIDLDPEKRHNASFYLKNLKGKLFPDYFYSSLYGVYQKFATYKSPQADLWLKELILDAPFLMESFDGSENENMGLCGYINSLSLITSNIRRLTLISSKLSAMELLLKWSSKLTSVIILERVLPYVLYFAGDESDSIRSHVPLLLVSVLSYVESIDKLEDINIFSDYIYPKIVPLSTDKSYTVRLNFAKYLGKLCEIAFKLWDCSQIFRTRNTDIEPSSNINTNKMDVNHVLRFSENSQINNIILSSYFENEIEQSSFNENFRVLIENITHLTTTLLCDNSTTIKRMLLEESFVTICVVLYQRQMVSDIISGSTLLLHAISVLNDQINFTMREAFFKILPELIEKLGYKLLPVILPFIEQGLNDSSEWVIATSTDSLRKICLITSIPTEYQVNVFKNVLPFLAHPNIHIRKVTVETIFCMFSSLEYLRTDGLSIQLLTSYFDMPIDVVLNMVCSHEKFIEFCRHSIPKCIYDILIKSPYTPNLLEFLNHALNSYLAINSSYNFKEHLATLLDVQIEPIVTLMKKIGQSSIRSASDYRKIVYLGNYITRINKLKCSSQILPVISNINDPGSTTMIITHKKIKGLLSLNEMVDKQRHILHHLDIPPKLNNKCIYNASKDGTISSYTKNDKKMVYLSEKMSLNNSTDHNFNHEYLVSQYYLMIDSNLSNEDKLIRKIILNHTPQKSTHNISESISSIKSLGNTSSKREQPNDSFLKNLNQDSQYYIHDGNTWLVCHQVWTINPHSKFISGVATSRIENLYSSASYDGTVCVMDLSYTDFGVNNCEVLFTYRRAAGKINAVKFLDDSSYNEVLCCCSCIESQDIHIFDLDNNLRFKIIDNSSKFGHFVDLCVMNMVSVPFILGANVNGCVNGYDMRIQPQKPALSFVFMKNKDALTLTKMIVDPNGAWIACGDIQGKIYLWDIRFGSEPIYTIFQENSSAAIRSLMFHPKSSNYIISGHESTNQVVRVWDLVTGGVEKVYQTDQLTTNYGLTTSFYNNENYAIFGASDMCLRSWNLDYNRNSCVLATPYTNTTINTNQNYEFDISCDNNKGTVCYDFVKSKLTGTSLDVTIEKKIEYSTLLDTSTIVSNAFPNILNAFPSSVAVKECSDRLSRTLITGCSDGTINFYCLK